MLLPVCDAAPFAVVEIDAESITLQSVGNSNSLKSYTFWFIDISKAAPRGDQAASAVSRTNSPQQKFRIAAEPM